MFQLDETTLDERQPLSANHSKVLVISSNCVRNKAYLYPMLPDKKLAVPQPMSTTYRVSVIIEKDVDGYFAMCPELQGCYSQGETYEEVVQAIKDAIELNIRDRKSSGEDFPRIDLINLLTLEVTV